MKIRKRLFADIKNQSGPIHIVLIGTKPDIIKQAPLILTLRKKGHFALVIHSGQHSQFNLSGGLEEEFGITPDVNLGVAGNLYEQQSQIIYRFGAILKEIKSLHRRIIPYICADTTTAVAAGIAAFSNLISTVHIEAGLRTMSPKKELILSLLEKTVDVNGYFRQLQKKSNWSKGSYEPYPEQFDTRAAAPSVGLHFAPTALNASHLIAEGYDAKRIFVVGNTVSDALTLIDNRVADVTIFDRFPALARDDVIRFCVHRRENITSRQRFFSIYEALEALVLEGRTVALISLGATEKAFRSYGLKRRVIELAAKHSNFIYTPVLPYYADTVALMQRCALVVTDSGSIQEETNMLGIPGVVVRFNSDRPEGIITGSNVLAPPISKEVILKIISAIIENPRLQKRMRTREKLYGFNVCKKIVNAVETSFRTHSDFNIFQFMEHQKLGLTKLPFWRKGAIEW